MMNLLLRLFDLESGQIRIDAQDIARVNQESLRAQIGVVTTGGLLARLDPAFDVTGSAVAELDDQPCA